mmetsp:Transcript_29537/g.47542  ORF Transcript_29537/g.47542 Transcript_29537/m.47542 type:complete len:190 (-) Transcript_29537:120-689(-)
MASFAVFLLALSFIQAGISSRLQKITTRLQPQKVATTSMQCCKCTALSSGPGETKWYDSHMDCVSSCVSYCQGKDYVAGMCDPFMGEDACETQDDAAEDFQDAGEDMNMVICCKCQLSKFDFNLVPVEGYGYNPHAPFNDDDSQHNEYLKCMGSYRDQGDKKTCAQECSEKGMFGGHCDMTGVHKNECK